MVAQIQVVGRASFRVEKVAQVRYIDRLEVTWELTRTAGLIRSEFRSLRCFFLPKSRILLHV